MSAISLLLALSTLSATPHQQTIDEPPLVEYRIEATLDESTHVLTARARLRYTNRAGAAVDTLWFHQHLNAFRPNSAWARRELLFGERRFQDLGPAEHAFERLLAVYVDAGQVAPFYPSPPDSTVVAVPLPEPLGTGETVTVYLDWRARLATVPRRQGRQGRHYDFAQWYPRIAVFEGGEWKTQPLLPQGEFYGEFATYGVTLEVAEDQAIGATGVPVEGEPGWVSEPGAPAPVFLRDFYPAEAAESLRLLDPAPAQGRKRLRWRAEDVHHFAWTADPAFLHSQTLVPRRGESAPSPPIPIHILRLPGDTAWLKAGPIAAGIVGWMQEKFGPYPWPQLTISHRLDPGGTEFPMLIMNASASEGLIVHEVIHQYLHGILANNEFAAGWLDEGFTDYVESLYLESLGRPTGWPEAAETLREIERRGLTQPVGLPGAEFSQPAIYAHMTYTKAAWVFRMLESLVGRETMYDIFRRLYERHALTHIDEADLRGVVEEVSGMELDWFFDQWLHTVQWLDYGIAEATTQPVDGRWRTTVTLTREGEAWMPVDLRVGDRTLRLDSRDPVQTVEVTTDTRPAEVVLDPEEMILDMDPSDDRRLLGRDEG